MGMSLDSNAAGNLSIPLPTGPCWASVSLTDSQLLRTTQPRMNSRRSSAGIPCNAMTTRKNFYTPLISGMRSSYYEKPCRQGQPLGPSAPCTKATARDLELSSRASAIESEQGLVGDLDTHADRNVVRGTRPNSHPFFGGSMFPRPTHATVTGIQQS